MEFYGTNATGEVRGYSWNPRTGYQQIVVYTGTPDALEAISSSAISNGYSVRYVPDSQGGYSSLEVTYGAAETQDPAVPLSDEWSLEGNDLEKSIFEHPNALAEFEQWPFGLSDPSIAPFRSTVERYVRGEIESLEDELATLINALKRPQILDLAHEMAAILGMGVESFTVSQYVLRRTRIVTSTTDIKPVVTNTGKVYSQAAMESEEGGIPATLKFNLPDGVWLKRTPTVTQYGADKWQIVQEYWHADRFLTWLYEVVA